MKIRHYILSLSAALVAVACSSAADEPAIVMPDDAVCDLVVSLIVENPVEKDPRSSRADQPWGEPYPSEIGLASESEIRNMYLYVADAANNLYPLAPKLIKVDNGVYTYKTEVDLRAGFVSRSESGDYLMNGRVIAMANFPGDMPASPLTVPAVKLGDVSAAGIPMWGVTSVSNLPLKIDETSHTGDIRLLRALSKFSLELHEDIKDEFEITGITSPLEDFETTLFCQPQGCMTAPFTTSLRIDGCFNPALGDKGGMPKCYFGAESSTAWLYTPERQCSPSGADNRPPYFDVTLTRRQGGREQIKGRVYMCDYSDGHPDFSTAFTQVVRNHDYHYVISLAELKFVISFKEWIFGGKVHVELE